MRNSPQRGLVPLLRNSDDRAEHAIYRPLNLVQGEQGKHKIAHLPHHMENTEMKGKHF